MLASGIDNDAMRIILLHGEQMLNERRAEKS
jgi:hypothetical protein